MVVHLKRVGGGKIRTPMLKSNPTNPVEPLDFQSNTWGIRPQDHDALPYYLQYSFDAKDPLEFVFVWSVNLVTWVNRNLKCYLPIQRGLNRSMFTMRPK